MHIVELQIDDLADVAAASAQLSGDGTAVSRVVIMIGAAAG